MLDNISANIGDCNSDNIQNILDVVYLINNCILGDSSDCSCGDLNQDGIVNGLVLASCGMCNFGTKDRTCSLSIQINEKAYNVKGTHIDDHGDSHAKDGFCNVVRVAKVSGKVKENNFIAETFVLQKN